MIGRCRIDSGGEPAVERHQVGAERGGKPEVARVVGRRACSVREQDHITSVDVLPDEAGRAVERQGQGSQNLRRVGRLAGGKNCFCTPLLKATRDNAKKPIVANITSQRWRRPLLRPC